MDTFIEGIKNLNLTFKQGLVIGAIAFMCFVLLCQFVLWQIAALIILAQLPLCVRYTLDLYKREYTLALYFGFVALQMIHMMEHVAQMVQIHLLGHLASMSHGLFGAALDVEVVHFSFDSIHIPFWCLYFIYKRRDIYMIILLPLVLVHCAEHFVIMNEYLQNGLVGNPGIFASGGLIGSPLSRPDLHFGYNLIETACMYLGFRKAISHE